MEEYRDIFLVEAQEYLQNMTECMLELEKDPTAVENLTEMFRSAHSLKGMSGTMGYELIMKLTHEMENLLDKLRAGEIDVETGLINLLFEAVDLVQVMIGNLDNQDDFDADVNELVVKLRSWHSQDGAAEAASSEKGSPAQAADAADADVAADAAAQAVTDGVDKTPQDAEPGMNKEGLALSDLNEFEKEMLKDAADKDEKLYLINVWLLEGSLLKSVRAYMVYKLVERSGEIVKSIPSLQAMEEESFDRDFSFLLLAKSDLDITQLQNNIAKVAEIEKVYVSSVDLQQEFLADATDADEASAQVAGAVYDVQVKEKSPEESGQPEQVEGKGSPASAADKAARSSTLNRSGEKTVRVETAKLDVLVNLVSELIINRTRVLELGSQLKNEALESSLEHLERVTTELQGAVMTLRMVPIKQVFDRFPRMVRDLSQEKGKNVELIVTGEETELDRTIVNQIGDPLVHLLRNAVDHGLEDEDERRKNGKSSTGRVYLEAHHEGSHVVVSVADDGHGIDPDKVKEKAIQKGTISKEEADMISADEAVRLIFRSGFSTAVTVTDTSGRGVGMDVVKTAIEGLNGTVEVKSELGKGSRFILRLPLTLAIIRALMVKSGEEVYAIPIEAVQESIIVYPDDIRSVQQGRVITLREEVLQLYCLKESFGMGKFEEQGVYPVVIVQLGDKKAGFAVDDLLGQQEIVIKSLSSFINDIKGVAGATILGDGRVTLILDVAGLLEDGRVNVG